MTDLNDYLMSVPNFDFRNMVIDGRTIPIKQLVFFVGHIVVARDSFPDVSIQDALLKLQEAAGAIPIPAGGVERASGAPTSKGCGGCGGGEVR